MITILTWVSIIAGGLLIILLLLSMLGGLDLDAELEVGGTDTDTDTGGLGILKSILTFVSVSSWVIKVLLAGNQSPILAVGIGFIVGSLAILLLSLLIKSILRNDENVNWELQDALFKTGEVYLRIPGSQTPGIVHVKINGAMREIKAVSRDNEEIATGEQVRILAVEDRRVIVEKDSDNLN